MTNRRRGWLLTAITAAVLIATSLYAVTDWLRHREQQTLPSVVDTVTAATVTGDRILFRNTARGLGYGLVASVAIDAAAGPRTVSVQACDRVAADTARIVCLKTNRGIGATFGATVFDSAWHEERRWPLSGVPSRTRLSDDGGLIATTSFVTGHSYAAVGFSTETVVTGADGTSYGNLESFALSVDGRALTASDRNIWGVTFESGDSFYATAASGGHTWLVRGELDDRTLTAVRDGVECPSLSPEKTRIAFKKNVATDGGTHWAIAVYDLVTGVETVLAEAGSVDDQIEWLDDDTVLYGMPRADAVGDSDVWAVQADGSDEPTVLIEHAWSPAVVRE